MAGYQNYQVKRNKNKNAVGLYDKSANYNQSNDKLTKSEKLMQGIDAWASYYRARPDIFVEEYLGIALKPFQKILIADRSFYPLLLFTLQSINRSIKLLY